MEGFPADETSKGALLPSAVAMEWPVAEKVADIKTIVNEEHSMIMAREIIGWMNHKLESRLLGEISTTSYMQMISHICI